MTTRQALPTNDPLARYEQDVIDRINNFNDPHQEWRCLCSELLGTFLLVLVAAGRGMMGHAFPGVISRQAAVVAPALMVMAIILFMDKVYGAHLNPAVSIAFALRRDFPWWRVPGYIAVQLMGPPVPIGRSGICHLEDTRGDEGSNDDEDDASQFGTPLFD
jgi:aquaporin Z